jgi:AcrR family transcriptional regulator
MPRQPDPHLEDRILKSADALWRRGGARALTMRAVARAAGTNTPAVYRRFKNREDLIKGILLRIGNRIRERFQHRQTLEEMADDYLQFALDNPNDYELFYMEAHLMNPPQKRGAPVPPIRESRPNFAFVEQVAAKQLGGAPEQFTELALALWSISHGTAMLLLKEVIPEGHSKVLRKAFRMAVKGAIEQARIVRQC